MEFTRNHYLIFGIVLLFIGIQLRYVETFVLTEQATKFVKENLGSSPSGETPFGIMPAVGPSPRKSVKPPNWLGFALMSIGAVLVLHSLAMNKPAG